METSDPPALILDWARLSVDDIEDRVSWLRESLVAGEDWGYCNELCTCVLITADAQVMYKFRWFQDQERQLVDKPILLKSSNLDELERL